ncbi:MAG: lipoyl synthase [Spirochaetes bacterium]|nr:lipoyl synthase [Spirochaetota bacterium]
MAAFIGENYQRRYRLYTKKPEWLRKKKTLSPEVIETKRKIKGLGLYTVCEAASCPNISECFLRGTASFMILGRYCTRNCAFCDVRHGIPTDIDNEEGIRIAAYIREMDIRYAVITSVTRDDLPDGGASHFAHVVEDIKKSVPQVTIELLVPDFNGSHSSVAEVMNTGIGVFSHNLETVPRMYPDVRAGADYFRSLEILEYAKSIGKTNILIKSGIMTGLGETADELDMIFKDIASAGVDILTIGQYLQPSKENLHVSRYVSPDEFEKLKLNAKKRGIPVIIAGPYIRSSYMAEEAYLQCI